MEWHRVPAVDDNQQTQRGKTIMDPVYLKPHCPSDLNPRFKKILSTKCASVETSSTAEQHARVGANRCLHLVAWLRHTPNQFCLRRLSRPWMRLPRPLRRRRARIAVALRDGWTRRVKLGSSLSIHDEIPIPDLSGEEAGNMKLWT